MDRHESLPVSPSPAAACCGELCADRTVPWQQQLWVAPERSPSPLSDHGAESHRSGAGCCTAIVCTAFSSRLERVTSGRGISSKGCGCVFAQVLDPQQSQALRQQMDVATDQLLQRHMLAGSAVGTDWCAVIQRTDASSKSREVCAPQEGCVLASKLLTARLLDAGTGLASALKLA